jgi:phosphoglycerate dehydrogenase-like enzyme
MLALGKRLKHKETILRNGGWGTDADRGFLLTGKTIGIVGLGRTGSGVARRLQGWGCHLVAYDPYVSRESAAELDVELIDDLPTLLRTSDYLTLHVVITEETTNMIGVAELQQMKPTAYLINTSRGRALDEDAVCKAIEGNWIAGAALDVYWQEPLPLDSPLRTLDPARVILTSHNVAASPDSRAGNLRLALESTLEVLAGRVPQYIVNPEVAPAWQQRFRL